MSLRFLSKILSLKFCKTAKGFAFSWTLSVAFFCLRKALMFSALCRPSENVLPVFYSAIHVSSFTIIAVYCPCCTMSWVPLNWRLYYLPSSSSFSQSEHWSCAKWLHLTCKRNYKPEVDLLHIHYFILLAICLIPFFFPKFFVINQIFIT